MSFKDLLTPTQLNYKLKRCKIRIITEKSRNKKILEEKELTQVKISLAGIMKQISHLQIMVAIIVLTPRSEIELLKATESSKIS